MMLVGPFQLRVFNDSVGVHEGRALELWKENAFLRLLMLLFPMVRGASPSWVRAACYCSHCRSRKLQWNYVLPAQYRAGQSRSAKLLMEGMCTVSSGKQECYNLFY